MSSLGYPFISRAWATLSSSSSTAEGEDGIFTVLRMCAYVRTYVLQCYYCACVPSLCSSV